MQASAQRATTNVVVAGQQGCKVAMVSLVHVNLVFSLAHHIFTLQTLKMSWMRMGRFRSSRRGI
jgi:hypothetical protein